ncbi:phosphate ABC transporter, ATPase subunit [Sphaerobacter thermophilus DSM 20745]|uniref:Phosphate ABC transporter, ATPase subunit n=2 Tax=Sphaerobacter TaxID=2056 RepID=D1C742_SPHTD|nr:phosphate ABC transporter ATP-binding protein [Sphaerobacter thermophilus]ACZ37803.1 phosphate ABC transporter, ATPase subunit [Sphaerobacter thermophilus DSM 20745]
MATTPPTAPAIRMPPTSEAHLVLEGLTLRYGARIAVAPTTLTIPRHRVTAIIGPSGAGKSTLLRALNRLHEKVPGAGVDGRVLLDGEDIYGLGVDPILLRRRVGMVFQQPNPLLTRSIAENVSIGLELVGMPRRERAATVEWALRRVALWDEVRDRLDHPATSLSGGQQQRLCIARTLAVRPEVILMDEPASALDPIATSRIEDLIRELASEFTVVIVTHNMQQAARIADYTVFMTPNEDGAGEVVEAGPTEEIFTAPHNQRTEDYITGRFG